MTDTNLKPILEQIEKEKGISSEELFSMIESALASAFKKHAESAGHEYEAKIDRETGRITAYIKKTIVSKVKDSSLEIDKVEAMKIDPSASLGDLVDVELPADQFGRIAAQTAKQIIIQKMRENERDNIFNEYISREGQIITGKVYRFTKNACILEIGKAEAYLPEREMIKTQRLSRGESIKLYVVEVTKSNRGPKILVSRTHPGLVAGLFKLEVPEVAEGIVEIKKIVRDPGVRCKVAVTSSNPRVDPIGACVGINGVRVQSVINELNGERMDLIKYSDNIKEYIANSLSPAKIDEISIVNEEENEARVIVSDDMLSLTIGKNGQNVRLAARLTNWHIDIQSRSQYSSKKSEEEPGKTEENSVSASLTDIPGIGEKTMALLKENGFETGEQILAAGEEILKQIPGLGEKTAQKIIDYIKGE